MRLLMLMVGVSGLLLPLVGVAQPDPTDTAPTDTCVIVNETDAPVEVNAAADPTARVIAVLPGGAAAPVVTQAADWYQIFLADGSRLGWLRLSDDEAALTLRGGCGLLLTLSESDGAADTAGGDGQISGTATGTAEGVLSLADVTPTPAAASGSTLSDQLGPGTDGPSHDTDSSSDETLSLEEQIEQQDGPQLAPVTNPTATPAADVLQPPSTENIAGGRWTHIATVIEHECGTAGTRETVNLTLTPAANESTIILTFATGASVVLTRTDDLTYTGVYADGRADVTLTFTSATTYSATETVTRADGCVIRSGWLGAAHPQ